jgi:hypothetical protein
MSKMIRVTKKLMREGRHPIQKLMRRAYMDMVVFGSSFVESRPGEFPKRISPNLVAFYPRGDADE